MIKFKWCCLFSYESVWLVLSVLLSWMVINQLHFDFLGFFGQWFPGWFNLFFASEAQVFHSIGWVAMINFIFVSFLLGLVPCYQDYSLFGCLVLTSLTHICRWSSSNFLRIEVSFGQKISHVSASPIRFHLLFGCSYLLVLGWVRLFYFLVVSAVHFVLGLFLPFFKFFLSFAFRWRSCGLSLYVNLSKTSLCYGANVYSCGIIFCILYYGFVTPTNIINHTAPLNKHCISQMSYPYS